MSTRQTVRERGMSPVESALQDLGMASARAIAQRAGVSLEDAYTELARLEAAGLADIVVTRLGRNTRPLCEWRTRRQWRRAA